MRSYSLHYSRVVDPSAAFYVDNFARIEPSKSIKDPEKQAAYLAVKREKLIQKGAFSAVTGRVAAWAIVSPDGDDNHCNTNADETVLLNSLARRLESLFLYNNEVVNPGSGSEPSEIFIKGCRNFTLPFLIRRMAATGNGLVGDIKCFKDPSVLLGTLSSACNEITGLSDDYWLLKKDSLQTYDTSLNYEMAFTKGDADAEAMLLEEVKTKARILAEYVKAVGGVFK